MRSDPVTKLKAVPFGQHEVQDEKCRSISLGVRDKIVWPRRAVYSETAGLQVMRD
jgi:hypothetical protein